jgi:hypothetical protein
MHKGTINGEYLTRSEKVTVDRTKDRVRGSKHPDPTQWKQIAIYLQTGGYWTGGRSIGNVQFSNVNCEKNSDC